MELTIIRNGIRRVKMADFSGFFKKNKRKKKDENKAEDIRAGFNRSTSAEEAMKMIEEAQDAEREKKKYKDGGAVKSKKSYFSKLKEMCKK